MDRVRYVAAGRVGRPHGLRGEVRVDTAGALPRGLEGYTRFYLGRGDERQAVDVEWSRPAGRHLAVKFAGVDTPEAARALTHATLYVERSELPPLGDGEYYHVDLLGCRVVDAEGRDLGRVADVVTTGAHDVLVVESAGREWLVPLVSEHVPAMDLDAGVVVVAAPEDWNL
ncbi:MAG: ribosome maturation factor RimM [Deferrisomatales bacterium]